MNRAVNLLNMITEKLGKDLNVLMLGEIESYDSVANTAKVIPLHFIPDQGEEYQPLVNVPIGFFSIGGYSIKVQPRAGDKLLILFADYDIDNVLIDGVTKVQKTDRTHSLEDAIVLPLSINFLNKAFNATQDLIISKDDTESYIKIAENGEIVLNASKVSVGEGATQQVQLVGGTASSVLYAK